MATRTLATLTRSSSPAMIYTSLHKLTSQVPFRWGIQLLSKVVRIMAVITAVFLALLVLTETLGFANSVTGWILEFLRQIFGIATGALRAFGFAG